MTISVIIPAYDEASRIAQALQGARQHSSEVVVVDDGSTDGTLKEAEAAGARVVRQDHRGYIAAIKKEPCSST